MVAETTGPQFESTHRQNFDAEHVLTVEKTKRKRGRKWSIFKNSESLLNEKLTRLSIKRINLAHLKRSSFDT